MAEVKIVKDLVLIVIGGLIVKMIIRGFDNKCEGKDIFGRKLKPKEKTYMDWKKNIWLGKEEYQIV